MLNRLSGQSLLGRELEADELQLEPVYGRAAQSSALTVQQVTIGRLAVEESRDFVDEPPEHGLELQLAGDDLRRAQKRRLLLKPSVVLIE